MDVATEHDSNVIEVEFAGVQAKLVGNEPIDDPLEDLLNEFAEFEEDEVVNEKEDFIFHHGSGEDFNINLKHSTVRITDLLIEQTQRIKEDISRLTYYLDEMYIDR